MVPSERVYFKSTPLDSPLVWAVFIRDEGFLGAGTYTHLFINGEHAAALDVGERLELQLAPGEYIFGVKPTDPLGLHSILSIDQQLQAGKRYYYRIVVVGPTAGATRIQRFYPDVTKP